jgi:hypothetical protein
MTTLWILDRRDSDDRLIIPLQAVLSRLVSTQVDAWLVRDLEAIGVMPFGISMQDFEGLTSRLAHGVLVSPSEFETFASDNVEIRDGEFAALCFRRQGESFKDFVVFTLRCVDSGLWECETDDDDVLTQIRRGFTKVQERPK